MDGDHDWRTVIQRDRGAHLIATLMGIAQLQMNRLPSKARGMGPSSSTPFPPSGPALLMAQSPLMVMLLMKGLDGLPVSSKFNNMKLSARLSRRLASRLARTTSACVWSAPGYSNGAHRVSFSQITSSILEGVRRRGRTARRHPVRHDLRRFPAPSLDTW